MSIIPTSSHGGNYEYIESLKARIAALEGENERLRAMKESPGPAIDAEAWDAYQRALDENRRINNCEHQYGADGVCPKCEDYSAEVEVASLRARVGDIAERVKARAVKIAHNYSVSRPECYAVAIAIRNMVDSIDVSALMADAAGTTTAGEDKHDEGGFCMATIWVIEDGEYSDYGVTGVFTTKEKAEFIAEKVGGTVSEWPLDPAVDDLRAGRQPWMVLMLRDGTVESCHSLELSSYLIREAGAQSARIWERTKAPAVQGKDVQDCLRVELWAKDEEGAIKSANEIRVQFIANSRW